MKVTIFTKHSDDILYMDTVCTWDEFADDNNFTSSERQRILTDIIEAGHARLGGGAVPRTIILPMNLSDGEDR